MNASGTSYDWRISKKFPSIIPYSISRYRKSLISKSMNLYYQLICVCAFGQELPEIVHDLKKEIYNSASAAIEIVLKISPHHIERQNIVIETQMNTQMGTEFENYDVSQVVMALNKEKKKAQRLLNFKECSVIEKTLLNVNEITDEIKVRLVRFYSRYLESVRNLDTVLLKTAIDEL